MRLAPGPAPVRAVHGALDRGGAFHLPYLSTLPTSKTEKERNALIDEVASIEKVEAELNGFIERRAKQNEKANAEEMMWKASVRKHHDKLRTERLLDRLAYHEAMLRSHSETFEALLKRHRVGIRLVEQALGITNKEERKTA